MNICEIKDEVFLPLIAELADPAMRPRHWDMIKKKCGT